MNKIKAHVDIPNYLLLLLDAHHHDPSRETKRRRFED